VDKFHISKDEILYESGGELSFLQNGRPVSSSAFYKKDKVTLKARIPRCLGAISLALTIFNDAGQIISVIKESPTPDEGLDLYTFDLSLPVGLYFAELCLDTPTAPLFIYKKRGKSIYSYDNSGQMQISICDQPKLKSTFLGGIIYHIFIDRFSKDENFEPKDGCISPEDWSVIPEYPEYAGAPLKNNTFYGGTLRSCAKKLDYIASLGTNLVYLSPIFESPSNHRYDTSDYMTVDKALGGDEALREFINEAKKRGIGVILDGVFNHTGADSIYFNRYGRFSELGAYQSDSSPYFDWYNFKKHPDVYESWWGIEILPRINTGNASFERFILEDVIPKYRDMGISGLRLDVADELSDNFIKKIKEALGCTSLLFGEVWEDASNKIAYGKRKTYYLGGELDGVMNYPLRAGIIDYLRNKKKDKLEYALRDVTENAPKHIRNMQMNVLGTHDTVRILTALAGQSPDGFSNSDLSVMRMTEKEREKGIRLLCAAYTVLATLPGFPTVFYADEVGLEGYSDPFNRMPYPKRICNELLSHYRQIGKIRRTEKVLRDGDLVLVRISDDILTYARVKGRSALVTVLNNGRRDILVSFKKKVTEIISGSSMSEHRVLPESASIFRVSSEVLDDFIENI